ncbi:MAG: PEGA domain-containing protein, partial [Spirochaetia bacterium]
MTIKRRSGHLALALCALAALMAAGCATSRGSTFQRVIATQSGSGTAKTPPSSPTEQPMPSPLVAKKGLEIVSTPDNAEVWIDGVFRGLSPYIVDNIGTGWHRVTLRRQGYYEASSWVDFESDYQLYQATLTQIMGFLQLSIAPPDSIVTVGGQKVSDGVQQFPVGNYTLDARSFGYAEQQQAVTISEQATTAVTIELVPAEFAITSFSLPKQQVNPANPGMIGYLDCNFSVTGPGNGELKVLDAGGTEVFSEPLPEFTTWEQSVSWNVRDASGRELPDGEYTITVTAHGKDSEKVLSTEGRFMVDSTLKVAPRSLWSGSSGLLYAPTAEVLPADDFQLAVLGAGLAAGNPALFQAPIQLGARLGVGRSIEIDASAGIIASSVSLPFMASVAGRWNFVSPHGAYGTSAALQAKLSVQYNSNVTGGN